MYKISNINNVILADNQFITSSGWKYLLSQKPDSFSVTEIATKTELIANLESGSFSLVIIDLTFSDFENENELVFLQKKFSNVHWLFFSGDLSEEFVTNMMTNTDKASFMLKDSYAEEFYAFFKEFMNGNRYICNHICNLLLTKNINRAVPITINKTLTPTETEILKEISLGKTTKEIAATRYISVHTVMTHRKNIFRKIKVNSVHEATKYAMRAGIVEMAEYYI